METASRPVVLVVDDDAPNLRSFERTFRKRYSVLTAASGAAALAILRDAQRIDVAFVDFLLPDMDGTAVLSALRRSRPHTARFLLTGYGDLVQGRTIATLEANGLCQAVITKPFGKDQIEAAVTAVMPPRPLHPT